MNRRSFLRTGALISGYLLLWGCGQPEPPDEAASPTEMATARVNHQSDETPEDDDADTIVVVGAGMAGLAAARALQANGFKVVMLEGRDRIGGRVWTDHSWPDAHLDLGASWIHGINGNPITDLAKEFEVETLPTDYDSMALYDSDGRQLTQAEQREIEEQFQQIFGVVEEQAEALDDDISIEQAVNAALAAVTLDTRGVRRLDYALNTVVEHEYAADISEMSLLSFGQDEEFDGGDVLFPGGYDQLVKALAEGLDIRLNQKVEQITYNDEGVTVTTSQGEFEADRVVVTLPLGVLQQGAVEFSPPLPADKREAIDNLGMGLLNKVYLRFDEPFWPEDVDLLGYIPEQKGAWAEWLNIYKYTGQPILLAFNAAHYGRQLEPLPDDQIIAAAMATLRRMFGQSIPNPSAWLITRWASDPFAGGSYSFLPVGAGGDDYDTLAEPVAGRLFFAGEATHRDYPSTVHGAFLSGLREAERIAEL